MEIALGLSFLVLYVLLGLRTFDRDTECAVIYTVGRTDAYGIRGPTTETFYSNRAFQFVAGSRVVVWTLFGLQRLVRVSGDLKDAWVDLAEIAPWGIAVRRPRQGADSCWSVTASGWDRDSISPYPLEARGHGVTEAAALRDLADDLWEAMRDE